MSTTRSDALRASFETLSEHEGELTRVVYDLFFEAHPDLLELFTARRSAASAQMVRETLMYAIDHLNGEGWVASNMASLGQKHVEYEVTEEMYGGYIDALLTGMAQVLGAAWTEPLQGGWRTLFEHLADLMIAELPER